MKDSKKSNSLLGLGLLTAISASLCCIVPVLALIAGTSGLAASFTWLEPLRPYLMGFTILVLGFAWYQQLKPKKDMDCDCETESKPTFIKSKLFLGLVTLFAAAMLAFPHYSAIFYPENKAKVQPQFAKSINNLTLNVKGMTCESCNLHVENTLAQLPGYINAKADYKTGTVKVEFDASKSSEKEVLEAVNSTGYKVTDKKIATPKALKKSSLLLNVKGLTCESCDLHVENTLAQLPGYINAKADYKTGTVKVEFDASKSSEKDVKEAVNSTGYKIVEK
jgi:mercuric ion transport protein